MKYQHIIWDFNGTLVDDVRLGVDIINRMMDKRSLPNISRERYREIFTFPITDYYKDAGFDFDRESFEDLAQEWVDDMQSCWDTAPLQAYAKEILTYFRDKGLTQSILSALMKAYLTEQLDYYGIAEYFEAVSGLDNHEAASKLRLVDRHMAQIRRQPEECLYIGDTLHDADTAKAIGCDCVLVAAGHQREETLRKAGFPIVNSLYGLQRYMDLLDRQ